jgi:hypothetical protein
MADPRDRCPDCGDCDHHGCGKGPSAVNYRNVLVDLLAAYDAYIEDDDLDYFAEQVTIARAALEPSPHGRGSDDG